MTSVNVICGGDSAEREVSLRSGEAVFQALKLAGYEVRKLDSKTASIDEIADCDVVFPALHGAGGEDGVVQKELEKRNVKFVGSGSKASEICFDKWQYLALVAEHNLPIPLGELVSEKSLRASQFLKKPFVLKPSNGGSSIDTFIVRDLDKIQYTEIKKSFKKRDEMLIEELIEGTELTVGVLDDKALPIIEIIPPVDAEFDYENKYNGATQELVDPDNISSKIKNAAQELALKSHQLTGCRDFSRTDIILDKSEDLYLLETNTIPGMTDQSLFPKMAAAGLSMPRLCDQLVQLALSR